MTLQLVLAGTGSLLPNIYMPKIKVAHVFGFGELYVYVVGRIEEGVPSYSIFDILPVCYIYKGSKQCENAWFESLCQLIVQMCLDQN